MAEATPAGKTLLGIYENHRQVATVEIFRATEI